MRKKQLQKYALTAEITTAVVVVITIAFLALEMRENTKAIHVQTHLDLTGLLHAWRDMASRSEFIEADLIARTEGLSSIPVQDRRRVILLRFSLWSIFESVFFAYQNGALDQNGWERFGVSICGEYKRDIERGTWSHDFGATGGVSDLVTADFLQYIESTCE